MIIIKMNSLLPFLLLLIPVVHCVCVRDQQLLLLNFKKSLVYNVSLSSKLSSWNSSADCCSWLGITCSTNGRVIGLDLSSQSISDGVDNSSTLFQLQYLQSLNLAHNPQLGNGSHSIPSAIGQLSRLRYLNLSLNYYSGQIPIQISHLTQLKVLDLSTYYIYDQLKLKNPNLHKLVQNLTELRELYLDRVQILARGSVWCEAISSSLPNLRVLSLYDCGLSGPFHASLAKLQSLSVIHLDRNNISAPVPEFFAKFSNLTSLSLFDCNLQGTFPKEIFQIPSLQSIVISGNEELDGSLPEFPNNGSLQNLQIGYTNFSGSLPDSIGNLKMLSTISIGDCNFTGSIPISMSNLMQLTTLELFDNNFEGSIPSFSRSTNLEYLELAYNGLTGNISGTQWENLTKLESLILYGNKLTGNIPSSLFSLPLLDTLRLVDNQFSGQLPETLNLSSSIMSSLNLGFNYLEGPIPRSIFNLRSLVELDLHSNNFSGSFPLNDLRHLKNLTWFIVSNNSLSLTHDATNFSYSDFPQFQTLGLGSLKLRTFPQFLRNQSQIEYLDLSDNQIQGEIPSWIWSFNNLYLLNLSSNSLDTLEDRKINYTSLEYLDLHSNQLRGQIPIFSSAPSMSYLDYSRNNFNSTIPTFIGDQLLYAKFFSISSNNIQGTIPQSICNSHSLEVVNLSNNSLSGTVPHCLTRMTTLSVLNLRRNNLTHVDNLSSNCSLKTLDISENQIQGQFLESLFNWPKLEVLNLGRNRIRGAFPCSLKKISTLRVLVLRSNQFHGGIECLMTNGTWPMLQIIDLAHNHFNGEVLGRALATWQAMKTSKDDATSQLQYKNGVAYYQDTVTVSDKGLEMELVKILTIFTSVDLSCNNFNGSVPEEIGQLESLHVLNLSNNAFTGAIPSSLSNVSQLQSLDLSQNKLSGQIPQQLTKLTFLSFLNLSCNQLVGRIPTGAQFPTFGADSFKGNKGLTGPPLTLENTTMLSAPPSEEHRSNFGKEIDWNIISAEIGFTCGFGIAVGSLLFCKRWRRWYYRAMYGFMFKIFPQLEHRFGNHKRHVSINQMYGRRC